MVAPYLEGGVFLTAGMWMVGPASLLGAWCYAAGAISWAGANLAENLAGGANSGMIVSSFGQSLFFGAMNELPVVRNLFQAYNSYNAFKEGDGLAGIIFAIDAVRMRGACFTGEMLIDVEGGKKRADELQVGDKVWSRDEHDPEGKLCLQVVQERFVTLAEIWNVHVDGQVLRTTSEHPFWVANRNRWIPARALETGDTLLARDGSRVIVERVENTEIIETVFNWRIAEYHTYFVGTAESQWSVWAHNTCNAQQQLGQTGSSARSSLRRALGAVTGWIAHHIIPVSLFNHPLVQAAARMGFEVNRKVNGVLLSALQHVGGHPGYITSVRNKLDAILRRHGGVASPAAVQEMTDYVNKLQRALPRLRIPLP